MNFMLEIVKYLLILEAVLIILIVILCYILSFYFFLKKKEVEKISFSIENYLDNEEYLKKGYNIKLFHSSWKKINVLIPMFKQRDSKIKNERWQHARLKVLREILLPIARKSALKKNWIYRFYAAECFSMLAEKEDEKLILRLINDVIPIVFYSAINAVIKNNLASGINAIISKMTSQNWLTRTIFLQEFSKASTTSRFVVERRLMQSTDPSIKTTCYGILMRFPFGKIRWRISDDLNSKNINLQIAAMKYLAHVNKKTSLPVIIGFLNDPQWEMRTAALRCLSELSAHSAIPEITKCLSDPQWWVRFAAVETLKSFGLAGMEVLKTHHVDLDSENDRVAHYVLNRL